MSEKCLSKKQAKALYLLADDTTEYLTYGGGANGGKSWLGCFWLHFSALRYPDTRYFIGRNELLRLKKTTLATFYKMSRCYPETEGLWRFKGDDHSLEYKNGSVIDLIDLKYLPGDPLYERYGSSEYTSGWIEEGGEVNFDAYDTLKSRINRWNNDLYGKLGKMLITCNPKKNWVYDDFYSPWSTGDLPSNMAFIQALVGDNPFREKASVRKLQGLKNKAKRERLLYGNWDYEDEPDQLIVYEWLTKARQNVFIPGPKYMGIDVARYGDDLSVIAIMEGNLLVELVEMSGLDVVAVAKRAEQLILRHSINADNIGVDGVGIGAGVVDILRSKGYWVHDLQSGSSEVNIPDLDRYNFNMLRSQMWFALRVCLDPQEKDSDKIVLKDFERTSRIREDITAVKYTISGDKKFEVESKKELKKRIGRSPDYGDAIVYCNWMRYRSLHKPSVSFKAKKKNKKRF